LNDNKKESIKLKVARYSEYLRGLIILNIAIVTGIMTVLYNVVSGSLGLYMLLFIGLGIIVLSITVSILKDIDLKMQKLIKELENG
jgi:hypothetical protein